MTTRTPQEAMRDALASGAVQAFVEGKPLQMTGHGSQHWEDFVGSAPAFFSGNWDWRPAPPPPEPVWRPWKAEEVPLGAWVRMSAVPSEVTMIVHRDDKYVSTYTRFWTFKDIFDQCEHSVDGGKTWHPCGVQEVSK